MRDDLYGVLGLEPRASAEQVERAYRFHLDLYAEGSLATYSLLEPHEAEEQRARVREAYEVLADPQRRREYDERRGYAPRDEPEPAPTAAEPEMPRLPSDVSGKALRAIREAKGVSLSHIATITKIGIRHLEYIEEDRFAMLPATVYLKGFLQQYAQMLGLDGRGVAEAYMRRMHAQ
jgi:curved DNA-binding protein CbpA